MEILGIIFSFIIFLIILNTGYLAALRPVSLIILVGISLVVGYTLALLFSSAWKVIIVLIIIGAIVRLLK